ncbi:MAG: helix-turn-helix transcriptional regulator [Polyangiaceae bacterium]|nr:helix-turn-helix transcriptional regulator [Polyangiaceae bacterium]
MGARFEVDGEEYAVLVFPMATSAPRHATMTPAEGEVVELALRGLSNEEIGAKRGSSPRTVANQLQAIYRKLGVGSRVELARAMASGHPGRSKR